MIDKNLLLDKTYLLKSILLAYATGEDCIDEEYQELRKLLMNNAMTRSKLPKFVSRSYNLDEFWHFIQPKFSSYKERRIFINQEFEPLLSILEAEDEEPLDKVISKTLSSVDSEHVHRAWEKALERRNQDPTGAITIARTLLESICKHIMDENNIPYSNYDLPKLFHTTLETLRIAPSQQTETIFRKILGNCEAIVGGVASLRDRLGDAHGKGKSWDSPAQHHAELAVNLAGSIAVFLITAWEDQQRKAES